MVILWYGFCMRNFSATYYTRKLGAVLRGVGIMHFLPPRAPPNPLALAQGTLALRYSASPAC